MIGALVILIATILIGVVLYFADRYYYKGKKDGEDVESSQASGSASGENAVGQPDVSAEADAGAEEESEECCGMHKVCEKTNLSPLTPDYEYYDDEELDRFRGREPESYTEDESEEFREVLMTLLPSDVAGWSRSLQVREIKLPLDVREELLMIVADLRSHSN